MYCILYELDRYGLNGMRCGVVQCSAKSTVCWADHSSAILFFVQVLFSLSTWLCHWCWVYFCGSIDPVNHCLLRLNTCICCIFHAKFNKMNLFQSALIQMHSNFHTHYISTCAMCIQIDTHHTYYICLFTQQDIRSAIIVFIHNKLVFFFSHEIKAMQNNSMQHFIYMDV